MTEETHMTPKDFLPHVLVVIAELTDYQANVSVPMGETYKPVCDRMDITEEYGGETAHGSKFTHRTIGLAMRAARGRGLTKYAKKGHWTCTAAGIEEARKITGVPAPANDTPEVPEAPAAARLSAVGDAAGSDETAEVVRLPLATPTHPYSDDAYIRSLAIESVVCFGAYSKRSDACKICPLAKDCIAHVNVRKAELAAEMDAEEARAKAAEEKRKAEESKKDASVAELIEGFGNENEQQDDAPAGTGPKGKFKPAPGQVVAPAEAQRETVCIQCNEVIKKGGRVMWANDEGVFHPECIEVPAD